jgi:hypothetical protein
LLKQAAEDEQVTVSEGDVDDQIAQFVERAGSREALDEQAAQNGIAPRGRPRRRTRHRAGAGPA